MLDTLRKSMRNIFGLALVALLVIAFAVWGIADVFTGFSDRTIAKIGSATVERDAFRLRYIRQVQGLSGQLGISITQEQARAFGLDRQTLNLMINLAALSLTSDEMGLGVSDDIIAAAITSNPNFAGVNGTFDAVRFDEILRQNGLNERILVHDMRNEHIHRQILEAMIYDAYIPKPLMQRLFNYYLEQRKADYVVLSPDSVGRIAPPGDSVLMAHYETAAERFTEPERRSGRVLVLNPDNFSESVNIEEAAIKEIYEQNLAQYTKPETRAIDQLLLSTAKMRETARTLLAQDKSFVDIVGALERTLDDTDIGILSRADFVASELGDAAFSLASGAMSEIIEGPLGAVILRVRAITPSEVTKFGDVRDEIRTALAQDAALDAMLQIQDEIVDAAAAGARLDDVARQYQLKVVDLKNIDAQANDADGETPTPFELYRSLAVSFFELSQGEDLNGELFDGTYYWLQLDEIAPAYTPKFATIKSELRADWIDMTRHNRLNTRAQSLIEKAKSKTLANAARDSGLILRQSLPLTRQTQNDVFAPEAIAQLFSTSKHDFLATSLGFGEGLLVAQLTDIILPGAEAKAIGTPIRDGERDKLHNDYTDYFIRALRDAYPLRIDEDNLEQALIVN